MGEGAWFVRPQSQNDDTVSADLPCRSEADARALASALCLHCTSDVFACVVIRREFVVPARLKDRP